VLHSVLRRSAALIGSVFCAAITLAAQDHAHHGPPASTALLDLAKRPALPREGIGAAHDAIGTTAERAQALYDRGLAYLHSYWWLEAARSLNGAIAIDSQLGVAYAALSIAYTELNAPEAARDALARALALASRANAHDRRHIRLRALQMAAEPAGRWSDAQGAEFRSAIDRALAEFPGDEELWLLRGLSESPDAAERGQGSGASAVQYFQKALAIAPGHVAAHHYLTHAYENDGRIDAALAEGATYAKMAPGIPHARHMNGHDLRRAGRVDEAIAEFEAADALEQAYLAAEGIPAALDWHYQHNLDLLATSYQYKGQMAKAERVFRHAFGLPSTLVQQEFNKREWPVFLLSRGRAREALDAAVVMAANPSPIVSAAGHVMIGEARLSLAEYQAAADEANAALRLMRGSPIGAGLAATSLQQLQAEFLLRTGQRAKARPMLEAVAGSVRGAPGPDAWVRALFTLESIARTAREAGDWDVAAWAAAQMIAHDANYAGSHYAAALAAEHAGDRLKADAAFARAEAFWRDADADLPEWQRIRNRKPH
jgi:tetratricopeptide (TPR) repeat protein